MNSLVGYGVSSGSDSDGDVNTGRVGSVKVTNAKKSRNFLLESGSASSSSESEPSSSPPHPPSLAPANARQPSLPAPSLGSLIPNKLPPPPLNASSDSSVFANPFKAQADQKLSALQKHVPLTMQAKPSQIGGKRICVSYRKDRRCRFGIKCKFAHDSDLQTTAVPADGQHAPESDEAPASEQAEPRAGGSTGAGSQKPTEEEESGGQQAKKRRVGLSNTLVPPKRAMKQYAMHRDRERINMS
ncbi:uncharacterized protein si:ch211-113e8.11 [Scophthalmus maximus]|uniref:C3H1-type domain-containing protein n=1 Tax=Scophthalmus maximus TaxID=52904 RepID=A0A6A4T5E5_SCOMX|nr:uncharacterized protein si:ch211-113e8.11 [Scophthalmus maximus]KAF0037412.1 hypothetical protein F2P81_010286 [Scophthalmus maximus]